MSSATYGERGGVERGVLGGLQKGAGCELEMNGIGVKAHDCTCPRGGLHRTLCIFDGHKKEWDGEDCSRVVADSVEANQVAWGDALDQPWNDKC
eukprot:3934498-Pleurochrysis_carterae.AAC.1